MRDLSEGAPGQQPHRSPIRILKLSPLIAPDIIEYLDRGKIGADDATGKGILLSRPGPNLDYWDGED